MVKKSPLIIFLFIFIISFWIWFQKVLKKQRDIPVKKEVIYEIKRRIDEIDKIARQEDSYDDVVRLSKKPVFSLIFIGSPAVPYLIEALKERHRFARVIYLQILGTIESKEAIPYIGKLLKDDSDYLIRMQCAISLGAIKDKDAVLFLKDGLKDKEMIVKVACATSLIKIGRKDIVDNAIKEDKALGMYLEKWQSHERN